METKKIAIRYNKKNVCRLPLIPENDYVKKDVIFGINLIDAEHWNNYKKHKSIQLKIENGILEEVKTKEEKITISEKKEIKKIKNKETGKEEDKEVTIKNEKTVNITDFANLEIIDKEKLIEETYNIDTLNQYLTDEKDGSIRLKIEKRIDKIKNAKNDDTIDHPDSHLKTSK